MNSQGFAAAGSSATGAASNPSGNAATSSSSSRAESSQTNGGALAPVGGSGGTGTAAGTGSGGSSGSTASSAGSGSTTTAGTAGSAGTGASVVEAPPPPADAFFADDFETGAPGTQPEGWTRWINYSTNASNSLTDPQFALLDDQDSVSGNQSVHFHATGNTQPAMLTRALPPGTNRLHLRVFIKTSVQQGSRPPDNPSNHDTLVALRATPNDGNFELRFGEAKGALGFNMVGPGRNDALAPLPAL